MNKEEKLVRPLEEVVFIDSTHVLAGPYCTYQLALLSAGVKELSEAFYTQILAKSCSLPTAKA